MVKLFWKRMDEAAEGVGVGGGAGHEGGGEGAPRVVFEYSYEEEEEIEEDTLRQAQHGDVEEQEGGAAGQDFGIGVQQQEGGAAAQEGGVGGQQQEGVVAAQEGGAGGQEQEGEAAQERLVAVRRRHRTASGSRQAGPSTAGHTTSAIASGGQVCGDAVNGVMEERKLLEGARSKLDKMSGKIIEGVAAAITKASEDAVEKQLKLVEERLVASVVKGIEKAVKEDLFYSTLPPESMKELKDVGLGKKGGKGVVVGEKSGAPIGQVASAGKGAVEKRGAPTPSSGAAGKGAGEKRGDPSQVAVVAGLLSKTKADSAAQLGIAGRPVEPPTKRAAEATESSDAEKASTVVAARHEKSKKPKVIGYAPLPPPDDQGKTRGCKAPFKGPGMMSRKGKPVSEQTVGSRKRFLGTFETEADQKFCTAICWRVYFPDINLKEYEGFTAQDEKDWKVYLDAAARMPTGVWSVTQEQGECRFDE
ncbi:unnamed protein product [Closterium sp. Naga37s-1]|nr:unnamed protein product [Closterium sp. Naga37s-1]